MRRSPVSSSTGWTAATPRTTRPSPLVGTGEADATAQRAADCEGRLIIETLYATPGEGEVHQVSFDVDAINSLDRDEQQDELLEEASVVLDQLASRPTADGTNLLAFLDAVEAHLEAIPGSPDVGVTLSADRLHTEPPVNLYEADLGGRASRPSSNPSTCRTAPGGRIAFVGVNTVADATVPQELADGVERFWRAVVDGATATWSATTWRSRPAVSRQAADGGWTPFGGLRRGSRSSSRRCSQPCGPSQPAPPPWRRRARVP